MDISSNKNYDVVIAGSGPAGISTAMHLIQLMPSLQDRIIILEKFSHPRKKICGGGINWHAEQWLNKMGLKLDVFFLTLKRTRIVFDQNEFVEHAYYDGGIKTIVREEFDAALVHEAQKKGITIAESEPLLSFVYSNDGIIVQTPRRNLRACVLVGADGAKSTVLKKLCRRLNVQTPRNTCNTLRFLKQVDTADTFGHLNPEAVIDFACTFKNGIRGYAWSFPFVQAGQAWLNTGIGGLHIEKSAKLSLKQCLKSFLTSNGIVMDSRGLEWHPIRWYHPESILAADRIILVGDAAGIDPLFGEGISISLGSGYLAANAITQALEHNDFSFTTYKQEFMEHKIGQMLLQNFKLAERLYHSNSTGNPRELVLSTLLQR